MRGPGAQRQAVAILQQSDGPNPMLSMKGIRELLDSLPKE